MADDWQPMSRTKPEALRKPLRHSSAIVSSTINNMGEGMAAGARLSVDIGGTFTDLVLLRGDGTSFSCKVSSTPASPEDAVINGLQLILDQSALEASDIVEVLHGTTVGSNTLLQKLGARCGLITTKGFRDVLEIGRLRTPSMFDLGWDKPEPLVTRRYRREVNENASLPKDVYFGLSMSKVSLPPEDCFVPKVSNRSPSASSTPTIFPSMSAKPQISCLMPSLNLLLLPPSMSCLRPENTNGRRRPRSTHMCCLR